MTWRKTMTTLALVATFSAPAALRAQQHQQHDGATLTGTFDLEFAAPWGVVVWTFELEQDGETFTGSSVQGMGTLVLEGTMKGHDMEFMIDLVDGPHAFSLEFFGGAEEGEVAGSVEFEDGSSSDWTFTRVEGTEDRR